MRVVLRRERRRRNLRALQSNPPPFPQNVLIWHSDLPEPGARTPELRVVVTGDRFLAQGIAQSPAPLCYYPIYGDPEEAFLALEEGNSSGAIIDLEGWAIPVIDLLDRVRTLRLRRPDLQLAFLASEEASDMETFVQAACSAIVINKRQKIRKIVGLMQSTFTRAETQERVLSQKQWKILLLMAQGFSLRAIARQLQLPYHRIIYSMGRIQTLLKLNCRQQLIRLLLKLSDKHC